MKWNLTRIKIIAIRKRAKKRAATGEKLDRSIFSSMEIALTCGKREIGGIYRIISESIRESSSRKERSAKIAVRRRPIMRQVREAVKTTSSEKQSSEIDNPEMLKPARRKGSERVSKKRV